jgi:dTDP-4-dehydrorhamnose reductase
MDRDAVLMKILLLGANGQLGRELARQLPSVGSVTAFTRSELDITDSDAVIQKVTSLGPDVIVNAAAYTAVDKAEEEKELANAINFGAVGVLGELANKVGAWLIHYSTDYVFDGKKPSSYIETDLPNPINVYGASKLAGEVAITAENCKHIIFRTTWVIGKDGQNFAKTILRLAAERESLSVINDQRGVPTSPALITKVTIDALKAIEQKNAWPVGIYHLAPRGSSTWHEVARTLIIFAEKCGMPLNTQADNIRAIATSEYPTPAKRPLNSQLDTRKLRDQLSFHLPDWKGDFLTVVAEIVKKS